jgi:hypothetical protein
MIGELKLLRKYSRLKRLSAKVCLLLYLTCFAAPAAAQVKAWKEPSDFRGIPWGASVETATEKIHENWQKRRDSGEFVLSTEIRTVHHDERSKYLHYRDKIGDVPVDIALGFLDNKLANVVAIFETHHFPTLQAAFTERYGKAQRDTRETLKTRMGVEYQNHTLEWVGQRLTINLRRYGSDVNNGDGSFWTKEWYDYAAKTTRKKSGAAAKDL